MGFGAEGFAQIGHVNATGFASNLSGDIYVDVTNDITLISGMAASSAYARIGHGGQGGLAPTVSGNILLIADYDIILNSNPIAQAQIDNLGAGTATLVVDDLYRTPCLRGTGQFILSADSLIQTNGGQLRVYTVQPSQNAILELMNGIPYIPGPFAVNTSTETWTTYYPSGPYGGQPFNLYYKVPCELPNPDVIAPNPIYELAIDNSQLVPLLPYFLPLRYQNYPYHPMICIEERLDDKWRLIRHFVKVTRRDCEPTFERSRSEIFENFLK
jgi:hypothetical protein